MPRLFKKVLIIFLIIIFICFLIVKVFNIPERIMKKIYPKKYEDSVVKYSNMQDLDPLLIFAIIKAESNFNENAVSRSGALGLMQIMDETAKEIAQNEDISYESGVTLYNPEKNIQIGTKYFANLLDKYDSNIAIALTAYNAGIGTVDKWINEGILKQDGTNIENIPYKETNNYVRKILRDYEIYKNIYIKGGK